MTQELSSNSETELRAANRVGSWNWAAALAGPDLSVWRMERFKTVTARADEGRLVLPEADQGKFSFSAWLRALLAMIIAFGILLAYMLRHRLGMGQRRWPAEANRVAALHGELSTRTRHVLLALDGAAPPFQAIVLLGRVPQPPARIVALWSETISNVPVFLPMSPRAAMSAIGDVTGLISEGLGQSARATVPLGLRDEVAMAFRVFLGAVAARWWAQHDRGCEVIFGITGTGDTTMLERANRRAGGRNVHAVHGQATGPNFLGISDLALFRSRHDARAYARLGAYGACTAQEASAPEARRGAAGLLLLSNLAHPMNPGFQRFGLRDETALLEVVGAAVRMLGAPAYPLRWKPHPVIAELSTETREALRAYAARHGFEEVPPDSRVEQVAQDSRWVVTSPSTVALDLLRAGCLSIVLDPQGSVLDTAIAGLPLAACDPQALAALCRVLDPRDSHTRAFAAAVGTIGPARALDLCVRLE